VKNPYRVLGVILIVSGAALGPYFYFVVGAVPLAAGAMSAVILGLACYLIANARPYISPEACRVLLRTGMENTAALLEELGVRNKAVYLPSNLRNGHPQALIPLTGEGELKKIQDKLPGRLIVRYGPGAEDMAIAVTTPGSINLDMLEQKPGPQAEDIESAINFLLTGVLDIASGVNVQLADSRINIEVSGARMGYEDIHYYQCLGSPIASIAAAISSESLQKPVRILEETRQKGKDRVILEVLS
jgi:hypothetical protein